MERIMADDSQKTTKDKIKDFENKSQGIKKMGGEKQVNKQHENKKLTARERLNILFDEGTLIAVAKAYQDVTDHHLKHPELSF